MDRKGYGFKMRELKTLEFPTDVIEEGWARVTIGEVNGHRVSKVEWPQRQLAEDEEIRLELKGLSLFNMGAK